MGRIFGILVAVAVIAMLGVLAGWSSPILGDGAAVTDADPGDVRVGLKANDWIKLDYMCVFNAGVPPDDPFPRTLTLEFMSIEGAIVTVRVTMDMSDGSQQSETVPMDVSAGTDEALGLSGLVIPANSMVGDSVIMGGFGISSASVAIEGETTMTHGQANRPVVYARLSEDDVDLEYHWDRQTGVLVEAFIARVDISLWGKPAETNMWHMWEVTIGLVAPETGATNVSRTNIGFTWSALGETDFFDWLLSANADLSDPIEVRERLAHTACTSTVTLDYETTYYWQVTAWRDGDMVGQSNISTFTTMPEPPPPPEVGVKAGDWIKSEYKISGWPDDQPYPEWLKLEFLSVEGTSTSVRATMRMSDGTEETDTVPVEVGGGAEASGLSGFIIPANSEVGDSIVMGVFGITFADALIEGETTGTYARADRTVVYAGVSQYGVELTYYWDKQTGVMVEASSAYGDTVSTARATETNMWEAATKEMPWWPWLIVAVVGAAVAGAVYSKKRKIEPGVSP